jgi:pyrroline-5-carboxylate reductase
VYESGLPFSGNAKDLYQTKSKERQLIKNRKVGFIGTGNMGQAMIKALSESQIVAPGNLYATNRSAGKLKKVEDLFGVKPIKNNEELIDLCDIIILAVKPQDLTEVLEPLASSFHEGQLVISVAAGFTLASLKKLLPNVLGLARVMPNTPANIRKAVVGYCLANGASAYQGTVEDFLSPLGLVVQVEEGEAFEALTVSCGSGTGFVFELMQYWQEWVEEHGFEPDVARNMVVQTFLGAAALAEQNVKIPIQELQDRVVSKKGVTAAGLQSMRELEIERALRYSFEKAVLRDQEISRGTARQ